MYPSHGSYGSFRAMVVTSSQPTQVQGIGSKLLLLLLHFRGWRSTSVLCTPKRLEKMEGKRKPMRNYPWEPTFCLHFLGVISYNPMSLGLKTFIFQSFVRGGPIKIDRNGSLVGWLISPIYGMYPTYFYIKG